MKRLSLSLVLVTVASLTMADTAPEAIHAFHNDFCRKALAGDRKGAIRVLETHISPTFQGRTPSGSMTKAQFIGLMKQMMESSLPTALRFDDGPLQVKGSTATVETTMVAKWNGKDKAGKVHRYQSTNRAKETWAKQGNHWMMVRFKSLGSGHTMDGRPIRPGMAAQSASTAHTK